MKRKDQKPAEEGKHLWILLSMALEAGLKALARKRKGAEK